MADHRVREDWMGERIETLADLLRHGLLAACVGFNPVWTSVRQGHYYRGSHGREFFARLQRIGLLPDALDGYEDDYLFERGIGFTDIVKRPTWQAREIPEHEYDHGRAVLREKLESFAPGLVIFTLQKAAPKFFRREVGIGFVEEPIGSSRVFVMPWKEGVDEALARLSEWFADRGVSPESRRPPNRPRPRGRL
jgi:TDG/mug DNA glycosylase family protein